MGACRIRALESRVKGKVSQWVFFSVLNKNVKVLLLEIRKRFKAEG